MSWMGKLKIRHHVPTSYEVEMDTDTEKCTNRVFLKTNNNLPRKGDICFEDKYFKRNWFLRECLYNTPKIYIFNKISLNQYAFQLIRPGSCGLLFRRKTSHNPDSKQYLGFSSQVRIKAAGINVPNILVALSDFFWKSPYINISIIAATFSLSQLHHFEWKLNGDSNNSTSIHDVSESTQRSHTGFLIWGHKSKHLNLKDMQCKVLGNPVNAYKYSFKILCSCLCSESKIEWDLKFLVCKSILTTMIGRVVLT